MIRAGYLKHKIVFLQKEITTDEYGRKSENYKEVFKTYSYINNLSGKEYWEAFEVKAENTVIFEIRYHKFFDTLNTKDFVIKFNNQIYNIDFIDNFQYQNKFLKLKASVKQ